jgi:hypothetical protein
MAFGRPNRKGFLAYPKRTQSKEYSTWKDGYVVYAVMYTIQQKAIRKIISRPGPSLKTCPIPGNARYAGLAKTSSARKNKLEQPAG